MDSITAIFNVYFCDEGTVLLDKKLKMTIISGNVPGRMKGHIGKKCDDNNDVSGVTAY